VQESIARQIVASVAQRVREEQVESTKRRPLEDLRAYDLVLQANRLSDDFRPEAQAQIGLLLEQALRLDPSYARAFTGLAYFHFNFWLDGALGVAVEDDEHAAKALHCAEQGVVLDPNDPRCHSTLGFICVHSKQVERGLHHLELARSMNPNDALILTLWAWAQGCAGRHEVGLTAIETAMQINPRHPPWYRMYAARLLFSLGRYEESLLQSGQYAGIPARRVRHASFRIAAFAHLDRRAEAGRHFAEYEAQLRSLWKGRAGPTVDDFVAWSVEASCLVQESDRDHLRTGMLIAMSEGR
ncbi:tetratricopeptide repeat protein, partial [Nostoc sp. NIES-2111]